MSSIRYRHLIFMKRLENLFPQNAPLKITGKLIKRCTVIKIFDDSEELLAIVVRKHRYGF